MNKFSVSLKLVAVAMIFSMGAFLASCGEEEIVSFSEQQNVSSEASTDSYFEDAESLASSVSVASDGELGGRMSGLDNRFCDNAKIKIKNKVDTNPDTVLVEFVGAGCTDPRGNVRKGSFMIIFQPGQRRALQSEVTTILNLEVNGVKISGTRTVKLVSFDFAEGVGQFRHEITLTDGRIEWPDGAVAEREAHHFRQSLIKANPAESIVTIEEGGSASGINRRGKSYEMVISKDLIFKGECILQKKYLPSSGTKIITLEGGTLTIDYGTGDCDNTIEITKNGETKVVTVSRD